MANTYHYGFRPWRANGSDIMANTLSMSVATAYQAQDDGSSFSVDLQVGDPVDLVAGGTVGLANGGETPFGIIVGIEQYHDGTILKRPGGNRLPGGTSWSLLLNESRVLVVPVSKCDWAICVDDNTTETTELGYRALRGKNAVHVCAGVSATKDAKPQLDATTATTATHEWRIMEVPTGQDFDAENVQVIVRANFSSEPGWPATPSVGV